MVIKGQSGYDSQWTALSSIAPKIGCPPATLRIWLRQYERDAKGGGGSAYFAKAEFDRLWKT